MKRGRQGRRAEDGSWKRGTNAMFFFCRFTAWQEVRITPLPVVHAALDLLNVQ